MRGQNVGKVAFRFSWLPVGEVRKRLTCTFVIGKIIANNVLQLFRHIGCCPPCSVAVLESSHKYLIGHTGYPAELQWNLAGA